MICPTSLSCQEIKPKLGDLLDPKNPTRKKLFRAVLPSAEEERVGKPEKSQQNYFGDKESERLSQSA